MNAEDKIIDRIAKLLAIAEHPNTPAPEAETALMQANKLMTKHAIDEALARQSQTVGERQELVREDIEIGGGYTFRPYLATILQYNAHANRVSMVRDTAGRAALFGTREDVNWVVTLHNMIRLQMLSKIEPKWDNALSYDENVYNFKVAGYKWKDINSIAQKNGHESRESTNHHAWVRGEADDPTAWYGTKAYYEAQYDIVVVWNSKNSVWEARRYNGFFHKLKAAYQRHARSIGDDNPVTTQSHQAYRLSYVEAFRTRMAKRFLDMKEANDADRDSIPGAALALRDLSEDILAMRNEHFPELSPEEIARRRKAHQEQQEREARERQEMLDKMTPKQREKFLEKEEREHRRNEAYWRKQDQRNSYRIDAGARARGAKAADGVSLARNAGSTDAASSRGELI